MIVDYLAPEQPTLTRLKSLVTLVPDRNIMIVGDLAEVTEKQQFSPALYLIYAGDQVPGGDAARNEYGDEQVATQNWLVVVAVRHAKGGEKAHADAGKIITEVIDAMGGHPPAEGFTSFVRVNGPRPGYSNTFAYFPLQFATNQVE